MVKRDKNCGTRVAVANGWVKPGKLSEWPWQKERREAVEQKLSAAVAFRQIREAEKRMAEQDNFVRLKKEEEEKAIRQRARETFGGLKGLFEQAGL